MQKSLLSTLLLVCIGLCVVVANNPPTDVYTPSMAYDFLMLSYASYCPASDIAAWNCTRCVNKQYPTISDIQVIYAPATDTQAYVAIYENQVFVAFRGSMDISSWITNLKFLQTSYPKAAGAMVHDGFYQAWLSVQTQVQLALTSALKSCPSCNSIVVTGHSLGAALSTLCMAEVVDWFPNIPTELMNYGSPRVGNSAFSDYFNTIQPNTWRVTNEKDLVPHVPPQDGIELYEHVTNELWYYNTTTLSFDVCKPIGEDPACSDSVDPIQYSIFDHLHYFGQPCCC